MTKHHFKTWKFFSLYNRPASVELDAWRTVAPCMCRSVLFWQQLWKLMLMAGGREPSQRRERQSREPRRFTVTLIIIGTFICKATNSVYGASCQSFRVETTTKYCAFPHLRDRITKYFIHVSNNHFLCAQNVYFWLNYWCFHRTLSPAILKLNL